MRIALPVDSQSLPFDCYPTTENGLFQPIWTGSNCRHEYGLKYMRLTHLHCCAYCGLDFLERFEDWLAMALDHVIPVSVCKKMGIYNKPWCYSLANAALACGACNGFCNRYSTSSDVHIPETDQEFLEVRNIIFLARKKAILRKRSEERNDFEQIKQQLERI